MHELLLSFSSYEWSGLKKIIEARLKQVMDDFNSANPDCKNLPGQTFADQRNQILRDLDNFQG